MPGSVLLDTTAAAAFLRGDQVLVDELGRWEEVHTSVIVLGELFYGARHSSKRVLNLERVAEFSMSITSLPCEDETARVYGRLKQGLREKGRPVPDNDLWIAATAVRYDLVLLCRDAHFGWIDEVRHVSW